ncbi:MAG: sigma 54-interacting transcriptional regulator [Acidimicrobiia bacterium]|nr:sigma 54-interacting transcriptional regulator [Acidimicrobiia bacterium]
MPQLSEPAPQASTIGELKASGWRSRSVKEELRANAIARIRSGDDLFPGILGYGDTVLPQLEHAVLAGHDVIFLGERGQAKTRMIRALTGLLDEWMPIVAGSEINDDPYNPISRYAVDLVAEDGDDTAIGWVHRDRRFGEKLATPDTSIADLIGEVDPIKVAEGRYLSDELTLHYGLVPRTNRGVFAINELPDLAERIQVGLLNILEERDVQIRGYKVRLPLDVMLVASANPEDYTNRGRMITPLKDRFGAQIRTHYPLDTETEIAIARQEAVLPGVDGGVAGGGDDVADDSGVAVIVPAFMENLVATFTQLARQSSHINQRSGVSVRLTVANLETLVAAAIRRALRLGESEAVPRISDLDALIASTAGKIEVEALDEDRDAEVIDHLLRGAVLTVFKSSVEPDRIRAIVDEFEGELVANVGDDLPAANYVELVQRSPAMASAVASLIDGSGSAGVKASAVELLLEGLHLSKRLNKDTMAGTGGRSSGSATYRGR